jgi:CDP-diacylglycerol--serine O-phosphatidyltransferase
MYAVYDKFEPAACLIFIAAIFDVLDGLSARLLHVSNPIGKQLDSLADVVSFGLVPGIFMMMLMQKSIPSISHQNDFIGRGISLFPFIITIFSALRLAKFNIDTRQTDSFIGLPTPANTLLIISLPLILAHDQFNLKSIILNPYFILSLSALSSYLLVSNLPLFAIKLKSLSWSSNRYQYTLIIISIILLLTLKFVAIPLIILFYILLSLIKKLSEP